MKAIQIIEKPYLKSSTTAFKVGDEVKIYTKVVEGDKTRTQEFEGIVIRRRGKGTGETFTVLKTVRGSGDTVEKVFPLHSPTVEKIVVSKSGKVSRACRYDLRKKKTVGE